MKLRKLEQKDAIYMLEWMHDERVVRHLNANFASKTLEDCNAFIQNSCNADTDLHLAIADEEDVYMGTVSLKHIDDTLGMAEFAITVRSIAMGKGFATYGMQEIIRIGLEERGLHQIIWCVSNQNERAVHFYDKQGFQRIEQVPEVYLTGYTPEQRRTFIWYGVEKCQK